MQYAVQLDCIRAHTIIYVCVCGVVVCVCVCLGVYACTLDAAFVII